MKLSSAALCLLAAGALTAADPGLTQIRSVYLLPMGGSLDQYQVVTDPAQADAVFTDRLGSEFENRLEELYPPPVVKAEEEQPSASTDEQSLVAALGEASSRVGRSSSSFARGRGNVFLVDRGSKRVLWSTFLPPRSTRPDELDRTAGQIVSRLDSAASRRVKQMEKELKRQPATQTAPASPEPPTGTTPPAAP
jgi:hypothetical protein